MQETPRKPQGEPYTAKPQGTQPPPPRPAHRAGHQPGAAAASKLTFTQRFRQGLSPTQIKVCMAAIAVLMALIVLLLVFAVACTPADLAPSSNSFSLAPSSSSEADDFDKDALTKVLREYAGVLLDETEDAGADYVTETLFIGDSNTARMVTCSAVPEATMANAIGIESMGITSVLGLRCVRFSGLSDMTIPSAVAVMQPQRIVINFGTNNAGMNTESFIGAYRSAIEAIQNSWPYADIFIASVFPISQGTTYGGIKMSHIEEFNVALLELASEMELHFLNWSEALKDENTGYCQPAYMTGDGVHLSDAGIKAIFEYFRTHAYESEDTRPMPLKAIPNRLPTPEGLFPKPSSAAPSSSQSSISSSSVSSEVSSVVTDPVETPNTSVPDETGGNEGEGGGGNEGDGDNGGNEGDGENEGAGDGEGDGGEIPVVDENNEG